MVINSPSFLLFSSNKLSLFPHHKKEGLILLSQSVQGKEKSYRKHNR
uniref:Uncharacterized protein n=1 Tax=Streptococcus suis TaxID=1307 RepID=A0A1X9I1Z4_STRSU|nr:hypothetical protein [Streptococcus suis]